MQNAKQLALACALTVALLLGDPVGAQIFTPLYSFTGGDDGANPAAGLVLSVNTLYGTTQNGGLAGEGTVFAIHTDGSGFTNLHSFTTTSHGANNDGAVPLAGLVLSNNTLYGTTYYGGSFANGTVFALNAGSGSLATVHSFSGDVGGQNPVGGLVLSGNTLYGTAYYGGNGFGAIFGVNTDSTGYTNVYNFTIPSGTLGTNADGGYPAAGLIVSGDNLYGTTLTGGTSGYGTVFQFNLSDRQFTTLHSFTAGSDGANPQAGLVMSADALYGTTVGGGSAGFGVVFAVNTNGSNFSTLYSFTNGSDGSHPYAGLVLSGGTLYGTASQPGYGSVFKINSDGSGFTTLYHFTNGIDGANPKAGLILSGNVLYGTAKQGGGSGSGTIFSLSLGSVSAPQVSIRLYGGDAVLTWPTNVVGFSLQSSTNLASPGAWSAVSPGPVVINALNTVTNPVTSSGMFYRLSQ